MTSEPSRGEQPASPPAAARPAVRRAMSRQGTTAAAVGDVLDQLAPEGAELILLFCAAQFPLEEVAATVAARRGSATVIGCTTAGEITPAGYDQGSIAGLSFGRDCFAASVGVFADLKHFDMAGAVSGARDLRSRHEQSGRPLAQPRSFALCFSDGAAMREEAITSALAQGLGGIPLVGGSAGLPLPQQAIARPDGGPTLFLNDQLFSNAALIALVSTDLPFRVFQTQHFEPEEPRLVITKADPEQRLVAELNAEPAATEYARLLGLGRADLTPYVFAAHPLVVRAGGRHYVRAIQRADDQDCLHFYCAIDEGIVLSLAHSGDLIGNLKGLFAQLQHDLGPVQAILGFECVLRYTEIEQRQMLGAVSQLLSANKVLGFNTCGEQFGMMHVSQTFTGIAFGHGS